MFVVNQIVLLILLSSLLSLAHLSLLAVSLSLLVISSSGNCLWSKVQLFAFSAALGVVQSWQLWMGSLSGIWYSAFTLLALSPIFIQVVVPYVDIVSPLPATYHSDSRYQNLEFEQEPNLFDANPAFANTLLADASRPRNVNKPDAITDLQQMLMSLDSVYNADFGRRRPVIPESNESTPRQTHALPTLHTQETPLDVSQTQGTRSDDSLGLSPLSNPLPKRGPIRQSSDLAAVSWQNNFEPAGERVGPRQPRRSTSLSSMMQQQMQNIQRASSMAPSLSITPLEIQNQSKKLMFDTQGSLTSADSRGIYCPLRCPS